MKVALAQIAPRLGDPGANLGLHVKAVRRARARGADLIVFPELSLTGYLLQDLVPEVAEEAPGDGGGPGRAGLRRARGARASSRLRALAEAAAPAGVVAGFVERASGERYHNAAACLAGGSILHVHRKVYLPTYGMFDEGRYFAPGETFRSFDAPWGRTGILICEDFWHLSASYLLALQGLDYLVVVSAGPVKGVDASRRLRSLAPWSDLARTVSRQAGCWVVYVNRVGYEEGWAFQGGSFVCDPSGAVTAEGRALEEDLVVASLGAPALRKARLAFPLLRDEKVDLVRRELDRIALERAGLSAARPGTGA